MTVTDSGSVQTGTEIPESDPTQYSITDPDNRLTIQSSDEFDVDLINGANDVSRLYDTIPIEDLTYTFDVGFATADQNSNTFHGWSKTEDDVFSNLTDFLGVGLITTNDYVGAGRFDLVYDSKNSIDMTG